MGRRTQPAPAAAMARPTHMAPPARPKTHTVALIRLMAKLYVMKIDCVLINNTKYMR